MNDQAKLVIGALIGAGLGYLIGDWYVVNYLLDDADIDYEYHYTREDEELELEEDKPKQRTEKRKRVDYVEYFKDQNRPELAALAAKYRGEELMNETLDPAEQAQVESELEIVEMGLQEPNDLDDMPDPDQDPAIISMEEYAGDSEYKHLTLHYYEDDVLTDEDNRPIERPERVLGDEALISFGELSHDEDIVYVRNHALKGMYEVVRLNKPYATPVQPRRQALSRREVAKEIEDEGQNN